MSEWPSGLRRQTQGVISFSVVEVSGLHMEAWVQIPLLTQAVFELESFFETVNIIFSIVYFAIWPMQIFNILVLECQNGHSAITPNSRRYLLLRCWAFWSPHGGVGSNPTSDEGSFIIGSVFETVNIIVSIIYFAIWPMPMIELSLISLCQQVRMAERSKAPDSRCYLFLSRWGFWSPHGGVGSNPTSDKGSFIIGSVSETVNNIFLLFILPSDQCQW